MSSDLRATIYQALGEASLCWSKPPEGTFDSDAAAAIGERIMDAINSPIPQSPEPIQFNLHLSKRRRSSQSTQKLIIVHLACYLSLLIVIFWYYSSLARLTIESE